MSSLPNLHKMISNLVYFATDYFSEQFTSVHCSLIGKITVFNVSYIPCIIFVGFHKIIYYHERGLWDVKGWKTALDHRSRLAPTYAMVETI
jgi:hypothetical protein